VSGDGVNGLEGLRNRLDRTVDTLADVRAEVARQGAEQKAQGRELGEVKHTVRDFDGKLDDVLGQLASGHGASTQRRDTRTGAKDVVALLIGVSGVVTAIIVAIFKGG
jgi:hypothetical protein